MRRLVKPRSAHRGAGRSPCRRAARSRGKPEGHVVAFAMARFRAGLEKTNDAEGTVGRVEHLAAHRLDGGDCAGSFRGPPRRKLSGRSPQDHRAAHRLRQRDARLVNLDHGAVGFPVEQVDRRRADEAGDEQCVGALVEIFGGAFLLDPAAIHHHHAVGHRRGFDLIVGDEDRGHAQFALDAADLGAHGEPQPRVEVRQRLVEQQQVRAA